jgi:high-affinity iron transporter
MQLGNVVFIVWRESIEALLVIGILNAWIGHSEDAKEARQGRMFLWSGVAAGIAAAVALAGVLLFLAELLPEGAQETYQTAIVLIAAALIVQMVVWMRRHGRTLKRDLETSLSEAARKSNWWGVFVLALLAVAREGAETAIFLYGVLSAGASNAVGWTMAAIAAGFAAAIASYYALQVGSRLFSWRAFFRVTEIMLLLLGCALTLTGVDNLVGLGLLPDASGHLWDSSGLLDENSVLGKLAVSFLGYRSRPDIVEFTALAAYWTLVLCLISFSTPAAKRAATAL